MAKDSVRDASSDSVVQDTKIQDNQEVKKEDTVSYESYQRVLKQLKKVKDDKKELESQINLVEQEAAAKEAKRREAREKELEKNGEYKKLLELKEKELLTAREELDLTRKDKMEAQKTITDTVKLHAFYEKLPGKIKKREYLGFVNLDDIVINPETKEIDASSVDGVVNKFMDSYGELVDTTHVGRLPAGQPSTTGNVDYDSWKKMSSKDMKKNLKLMIEKRKTGG